MIERIEKNIFFRFTRIFAWLIIAPAFLALVYSGYKVLTGFVTGSETVKVTYEEIKEVMEGSKNPWDVNKGESQSFGKSEKDQKKYTKEINEILAIFGNKLDREKGEQVFRNVIMKVDEKDRKQFIKGLISVLKKAPSDDRLPNVADTYISLWEVKKTASDMEAASKKADKIVSLWILAGAFAAISVFSLLLVLLAIEKNTRHKTS